MTVSLIRPPLTHVDAAESGLAVAVRNRSSFRRESAPTNSGYGLKAEATAPKPILVPLDPRWVNSRVPDIPSAKQITTSIVETAGEVDDLQLGKSLGQLFDVAGSAHYGSNAAIESILLKGVQKFSLHPLRLNSVGSENEDEPIAALECSADLVMSLPGTLNVGFAIPSRNPILTQDTDQRLDKRLIFVRMRDKDFRWQVCRPSTCAHAARRSLSAMCLTSGMPRSGFGRSTQCNLRTIQGTSPCGRRSRPPTATGISRLL